MSKTDGVAYAKSWAAALRDHCGDSRLAEALEQFVEVIAASRRCIRDRFRCDIDCRKCPITSCPAYSATVLLDEWEARNP